MPTSQQNGGIWGPEGPSPDSTPPPAGGGKINTEFTKSGPVISPTAVKELSSQSNRNQPGLPGTLLLPQGTEIPLQLGHQAGFKRTQSATNGHFLCLLQHSDQDIPPRPKASQRFFLPPLPPWKLRWKKKVPDRLTESRESPLLKKEREKTLEQVGGGQGQRDSHLGKTAENPLSWEGAREGGRRECLLEPRKSQFDS